MSNYVTKQRNELYVQFGHAGNDSEKKRAIRDQLTNLNREEHVMNILIGAVVRLGGAAEAKRNANRSG